MEKTKTLESVLFVFNTILGTTLTIEDVSNWIGLLILSFQAFLVVYNIIIKVYQNAKNGKMEENDKIIENGIKQLDEIKKEGNDEDGK